MTGLVVAVVLVGAIFVFSYIHRRRRWLLLPRISDEEFTVHFGVQSDEERRAVLEERWRIATILALPSERLAPTLEINEIVVHFEPLVEVHLGVSDLLDEAEEEAKLAGVEFPEEGLATVAEYIRFMLQVRDAG